MRGTTICWLCGVIPRISCDMFLEQKKLNILMFYTSFFVIFDLIKNPDHVFDLILISEQVKLSSYTSKGLASALHPRAYKCRWCARLLQNQCHELSRLCEVPTHLRPHGTDGVGGFHTTKALLCQWCALAPIRPNGA
ncbi:hypothetical protein J1N35_017759 [Gossypium stocksii]|uniref:Uncharacterized protein n=1 Tax=Gossypium stocksii TaxID=47602 RepID=A0A9D4A4D0_9ROSI|nr:hypothetical protein J1N35_017759 [Gossypium stocksii]